MGCTRALCPGHEHTPPHAAPTPGLTAGVCFSWASQRCSWLAEPAEGSQVGLRALGAGTEDPVPLTPDLKRTGQSVTVTSTVPLPTSCCTSG